jgi:hypothetical protein
VSTPGIEKTFPVPHLILDVVVKWGTFKESQASGPNERLQNMSRPLRISFTSPNTRTVTEWRGLQGARAWAREVGVAMALRANGSGILFYMDAGKLRQRTFADVRPSGAYC